MTNLRLHAERELEILEQTTPNTIIGPFKNEILDLCERFGQSGQSGGSAPFTSTALAQAIKKLLMFETITPLTGEDGEWVEVGDDDWNVFQNLRDSRVFKNKDDNKAYFIEAVVFDGDVGGRFTSNGSVKHNDEIIRSAQYVKEFPLTPKTFYVDVFDYRWVDKEDSVLYENGAWWTHVLKDERQLDEVFKYYNKK